MSSSNFFESALNAVERPRLGSDSENSEVFWRKDPPVFHEGAIIRGGMFPHQRAFWDLPNFIKALIGGYGSGKTMIGSKLIISLALQNAPHPVAAISPSFAVARETTIATLKLLLSGKQTLYGRQMSWRYNTTEHKFKIRFRGRTASIIVYSGDDPDSLRGPNLGAAWIDEPFLQDVNVFHQIVARVRHPEAPKKLIAITGTPEQLNWGYDLCVGEMKEKHDVGMIQASTRENKALDPGYVSRLEGSFSGPAATAYVEGGFVNLSTGLVYHAFNVKENVVDLPMPPGAELGAGMDFNVNPMSSAVFWRAGSHMHIFDEIELPNADTEFMCSTLRERYGDHLSMVYPDATGQARKSSAPGGKSDFWYIQSAGFVIRAPHENPKRRDRYNAVNGKFKSRNGAVSLTISPKCKRLIKYFSTYSYEQMNKQEDMSHLLDAATYPVSFLFPVSKDVLSVHKVRGF